MPASRKSATILSSPRKTFFKKFSSVNITSSFASFLRAFSASAAREWAQIVRLAPVERQANHSRGVFIRSSFGRRVLAGLLGTLCPGFWTFCPEMSIEEVGGGVVGLEPVPVLEEIVNLVGKDELFERDSLRP